ncbi:MAG: hypothetical protein U0235_26995 [Polyangiaceae bacterium]
MSHLHSLPSSLLTTSLALSLVACSSRGEPSAPVTEPPAAAPVATVTPVAVSPKRTVEVRNPFGNTETASNLMADGDFELTGRFDQQPWLAFGNSGQSVLNFETGGKCRSGVRCLVLKPGDAVLGWFATPKEGKVSISFWARPIGGTCKDLTVQVMDIDEALGTGNTTVDVPAPKAESDGQCHFTSTVSSYAGGAPALWLHVQDSSKVTGMIVDDVVALPVAPNAAQLMSFQPAVRAVPQPRLLSAAAWWRTHRRFGLAPTTGPERPAPTDAMKRRER